TRNREPGDVSPGPGKTGNQAGFERGSGRRHHDRYRLRRVFRCPDRRSEPRDDDIDFPAGQLFGETAQEFGFTCCRADLDLDIPAFDVAKIAKSPPELGQEWPRVAAIQHADDRHRLLLRMPDSRPQVSHTGSECAKKLTTLTPCLLVSPVLC